MLETEIKNLTEAVKALTEAIRSQASPVEGKPKDEKVVTKTDKKEDPKTEQRAGHEKEEVLSGVTASDIQSLCMRIVQADRSKADAIRKVLDDHGAKSVTRLDAKHYDSVMSALTKLSEGR